MTSISEFIDVEQMDARSLERAFDQFCEQTEKLQTAYDGLKRKVEAANLELEAVNRELEAKVRKLDEMSNFHKSILESIPTAVVVTDLKGGITTFNSAAEDMWGTTAGYARGRHYEEVMGEHGGLLAKVLEDGKRREGVRRELTDGDARVLFSSTADVVHDSRGNPIGAVQTDRDLTQVCILERQLIQQEKLADLGRMAANMAHEIRKPLNGIKGFASLLKHESGTEEKNGRYLANIMSATDRLNNMLGELLDFAKPADARPRPCDLAEAAGEVAQFISAENHHAGDIVTVDIPDDLRFVRADPAKLRQVLLNLVKNAVDAVGNRGKVGVRAEPEATEFGGEQGIRVIISDNGSGIAPEKIDVIRQPFFSGNSGAGLGLAICDRILQQHHSELEINSVVGKGTTVEFRLSGADKMY